jgi:hypothetical protein
MTKQCFRDFKTKNKNKNKSYDKLSSVFWHKGHPAAAATKECGRG